MHFKFSKSKKNLLKDSEPTPNYGATSSSAPVDIEAAPVVPIFEPKRLTTGFQQVLAGLAVFLSGGVKIVELILRLLRGYEYHDWFVPVPGMLIIFWIAVYMLQADYILMLGHETTEADPPGYAKAREIASAKLFWFITAHILLFLWTLFLLVHLPICSLISVTLAFFILIYIYANIHHVRADRHARAQGSQGSQITPTTRLSPSFLQGPISALLIITALIHFPHTIVIVITTYNSHANLNAIEWPLAWWIVFVNLFGSHVATRVGYITERRSDRDIVYQNQLQANGAVVHKVDGREDSRMVPVDLACVIGLFWGSLAVAAGTGSVNYGPVSVLGYIGCLWQGLAIIGAIL